MIGSKLWTFLLIAKFLTGPKNLTHLLDYGSTYLKVDSTFNIQKYTILTDHIDVNVSSLGAGR